MNVCTSFALFVALIHVTLLNKESEAEISRPLAEASAFRDVDAPEKGN